ncbi:hypothetical protein [Acidisoma sp. 7E03]
MRAELAIIAVAWCDRGYGAFEAIDALGEAIVMSNLSASYGELRVSFIKTPTASTYYFLTARGLEVLFDDREKAALARRVLIAGKFKPFRTVQCSFEPWTEMVADAPPDNGPSLPVPRRIVRDHLAIVPLSVGPLLLIVPPQPAGDAEEALGNESTGGAPAVRAEATFTQEVTRDAAVPDAISAQDALDREDAVRRDPESGTVAANGTEQATGAAALQTAAETQINAVFKTWRDIALPQLLLCLADEIWRQDGEIQVALTGPRRRKLRATLETIDAKRDFKIITEVAEWVFNSGRDAETRHTLFVYELAREWPGEGPFASTFAERAPGALEAAKTAFRMHVRDASKETLKSLQELRKTLADDVTRVVAQTRELTGTLWRDLLVVVAAVLGRFSLLASLGTGEAGFANALLYGLAVYLAFSLGMVLFANARFMALFRMMQANWQTKLYGFVDSEDFKSLATEPLNKAEGVYECTRNAAITAYGLTVIALIALAILIPGVPPRSANTTIYGDAAAHASSAAGPGKGVASSGSVFDGNGPQSTAGNDSAATPSRAPMTGAPAAVVNSRHPNAKDAVRGPSGHTAVPAAVRAATARAD